MKQLCIKSAFRSLPEYCRYLVHISTSLRVKRENDIIANIISKITLAGPLPPWDAYIHVATRLTQLSSMITLQGWGKFYWVVKPRHISTKHHLTLLFSITFDLNWWPLLMIQMNFWCFYSLPRKRNVCSKNFMTSKPRLQN